MAQYITLDQLEDGMLLAEPVLNKFGNTLLPAGAKVNLKQINLLKTWNIKTLCVKGDEIEENTELTAEQKQSAKERLQSRMFWVPRNELENDLYKLGILAAVRLNQKQ